MRGCKPREREGRWKVKRVWPEEWTSGSETRKRKEFIKKLMILREKNLGTSEVSLK